MTPCHRCHPECPLWHVSCNGLAASCGQFAWRKSSVRTRDKKKEKCLWFQNVVYFGSALFSQCLVWSFLRPQPSPTALGVLVGLKLQGLKSDHIHAWPTPALLPCICMQAGEERSALVLMVLQPTELVLSFRACEQFVKRACDLQRLLNLKPRRLLLWPETRCVL